MEEYETHYREQPFLPLSLTLPPRPPPGLCRSQTPLVVSMGKSGYLFIYLVPLAPCGQWAQQITSAEL